MKVEGLGEQTPDGPPLNLIGRRQGSGGGKSLLLQAHMDTVPPGDESHWTDGPWLGRIADGRIYPRGTHDDRVGVAMIWIVADVISHLEILTPGLISTGHERGRILQRRNEGVCEEA